MGYLLFNTLSAFILLFLPCLLVGGTSNYVVLLKKRLHVNWLCTEQSDRHPLVLFALVNMQLQC